MTRVRYGRSDPIGLMGGINPYPYTKNDPLNKIDPSGRSAVGAMPWVSGGADAGFFGSNPIGWVAAAGLGGYVIGGAIYDQWGNEISDAVWNATHSEDAPDPTAPIPDNPGGSPWEGWDWKGSGTPESGKGNWVNPETGQKIHPDLKHPAPKGPHWGLTNPDGAKWDYFPDTGKWQKCK